MTRDPTDEPERAKPADTAPAGRASLRATLRQHPVRTAVAAVVALGAGTFAGRVALRLTRRVIQRVTGTDAGDLVPSQERAPDPWARGEGEGE